MSWIWQVHECCVYLMNMHVAGDFFTLLISFDTQSFCKVLPCLYLSDKICDKYYGVNWCCSRLYYFFAIHSVSWKNLVVSWRKKHYVEWVLHLQFPALYLFLVSVQLVNFIWRGSRKIILFFPWKLILFITILCDFEIIYAKITEYIKWP